MKKTIKYLFVFVLLLGGILGFTGKVAFADEEVTTADRTKVNVYMFRGEGCGYCAKALSWFEEIEPTEGQYYELITYEVWNDEDNKALMVKVANYLGEDNSSVPYIIIGKKSFQGFSDESKTPILEQIHAEYNKNVEERFDVIKDIEAGKDKAADKIITYGIILVVLAIIAFVIIARNRSNSEDAVNYEYDEDKEDKKEEEHENDDDDEEIVEEHIKKPVKKETSKKASTKKETVKKETTKKTTKGASTKKATAKTSTGKRGRPPKKK